MVSRIPDTEKGGVKSLILSSEMQHKRQSHIFDKVLDTLVDKAWSLLQGYIAAHFPVISLIAGDETLRTLRILAFLSCPDPDKHSAVREHALKPLEKQVQDMLTDETKQRLRTAFPASLDDDAFGQTA